MKSCTEYVSSNFEQCADIGKVHVRRKSKLRNLIYMQCVQLFSVVGMFSVSKRKLVY